MHKHKSLVTIISTALLIIGLIASSFLTKYSDIIASLVGTITAIIGAVALYIQFKKDKEINEASFIVSFYEQLYNNPELMEILNILNLKANGEDISYIKDKKYSSGIINYLSWIRTLCSLIEREVLTFDIIDEVYAYKFFVATNCKELQDVELVKYAQFNEIIYRVHKEWTAYRKKHGKSILMEETSLDKAPCYESLTKSVKKSK